MDGETDVQDEKSETVYPERTMCVLKLIPH